jgi:hypothetical protein
VEALLSTYERKHKTGTKEISMDLPEKQEDPELEIVSDTPAIEELSDPGKGSANRRSPTHRTTMIEVEDEYWEKEAKMLKAAKYVIESVGRRGCGKRRRIYASS